MPNNYKILFVCLGNICRSPAGENVMRDLTEKEQLSHITCDSAGTAAYHIGKKPDSRMTSTVEARGIRVTGNARQIKAQDLIDFDLILTMDDENYQNVLKLSTAKEYGYKVKKFVKLCSKHNDIEVPDPYYGGQEGFEHVVDLLEDGCLNLIQELKEKFS